MYGIILLHSVNLRVKPGQLVAVVGQVGAGKSSIIQALLGEMEKHGGNVALRVPSINNYCNNFDLSSLYSVCVHVHGVYVYTNLYIMAK